jgi:4-amino-4-deoxy-L-arabinose transferase-like glycosyltransferase
MRLAEIEAIMLNVGLVLFAAAIFYIIYDLAKKSNAGKFGTFILFLALGLGLVAFLIKTVVVEIIGGGSI